MTMTTWRRELDHSRKGEPLVFCTLTEKQLDKEFDDGFGGSEGKPFLAWSLKHVFFPCVYDGQEWVGKVPRHPQGKLPKNFRHFGSE